MGAGPEARAVKMPVPPLAPHSKPFDLVGVGEASMDLVAVAPTFPRLGAKSRLLQFRSLPGGQAATATVACGRLGWRCRFVGALGDDAYGEAIRRAIAREGVDVCPVVRPGVASRTALILVTTDTGERTILWQRDDRLALGASDLSPDVVTAGRVLLVDAEDVAASTAAAGWARAEGIPTVLDVDRPHPELGQLLRQIDVLVAAEPFACSFTGDPSLGAALGRLQTEFRTPLVIATLGPGGSLARCQGRELRTPAFAVTAVDTTGAGDAFRGGFVAAWLEGGPEADVAALLEYANAVAALKCQQIGAMAGLPHRADLEAFVTAHGRERSN
jgi:sulfofructose kinase